MNGNILHLSRISIGIAFSFGLGVGSGTGTRTWSIAGLNLSTTKAREIEIVGQDDEGGPEVVGEVNTSLDNDRTEL